MLRLWSRRNLGWKLGRAQHSRYVERPDLARHVVLGRSRRVAGCAERRHLGILLRGRLIRSCDRSQLKARVLLSTIRLLLLLLLLRLRVKVVGLGLLLLNGHLGHYEVGRHDCC